MESPTVAARRPLLALAVLLLTAGLLPHPLGAQTIVGRVLSESERQVVEGAEIYLADDSLVDVTDGSGLFRIGDLAAGRHVVTVRYLGLETEHIAVDLRAGETVSLTVGLEIDVIPVPAIHASVDRSIPVGKLYGFYRRMRSTQGHFISREEIADHPGSRPTDLLRQVPGLTIGAARLGDASVTMSRTRGCVPDYYVDGTRAPFFNVDNLQKRDIAGIEVYRGHAEIPMQFKWRADCGVIVIWTRDPSRMAESG